MILKTPNIPEFDKNLWADYFELSCLINRDNIIVDSDIYDRKQTNKDNIIVDSDEVDTRYIDKSSKGEIFTNEVLDIIGRRVMLYKKAYPFEKVPNGFKVRDKDSNLCKLYIYLLMCSSLRHFSSLRSDLTGDFELFSAVALKNMLSNNFQIKSFGKNSVHTSSYSGHIMSKLQQLCNDISALLIANPSSYPPTATGDDGLDLVAFLKLPDSLGSNLVFFVNCKCDENWKELVHYTLPAAWRSRIAMPNDHSTIVMIPYCNREASGEWQRGNKVAGYFLVDRYRLIHYLKKNTALLSSLRSEAHVAYFLSQKEDII